MLGWSSDAASRDSRRKRSRKSASPNAGVSSFKAAWRHLVDARVAAPHAAELAPEAVDEDLGPPARLRGRTLERVELRLLELRGDIRERARGDVDPALEQLADPGRDGLDDVDLARAHVELLRHAIARPSPVVRELDHDLLASDDRRVDRGGRNAAGPEERADLGALPAQDACRRCRSGRLAGDRHGPADEVGADRHARG